LIKNFPEWVYADLTAPPFEKAGENFRTWVRANLKKV